MKTDTTTLLLPFTLYSLNDRAFEYLTELKDQTELYEDPYVLDQEEDDINMYVNLGYRRWPLN